MVVSPWSLGDVVGSRTDGVARKRQSRKKGGNSPSPPSDRAPRCLHVRLTYYFMGPGVQAGLVFCCNKKFFM